MSNTIVVNWSFAHFRSRRSSLVFMAAYGDSHADNKHGGS